MSAVSLPGSGGGSKGEQSQDFDLNLAPIIDCFTVLITYLLASASFISLGILDVGVATVGEGAAQQANTTPAVTLTVEIKKSQVLQVKVNGAADQSFSIPATADGNSNVDALDERVKGLRKRWPLLEEVTVTGENAVKYREIVRVVEGLRKAMPKVVLGDS